MSELSFLIDLLLNQRLSKPVKELIANRIREIEIKGHQPTVKTTPLPYPLLAGMPPNIANQSPSTIANFLKEQAQNEPPQTETPIVAATAQAAMAMEARNTAIKAAMSGKPEPGRTSPRKF